MLVGRVVRHQVDQEPDSVAAGVGDQLLGLTQVADTQPVAPRVEYSRLVLNFQGQECVVDADNTTVIIGRVAGNDLMVPTDLTSRQHASIEYKRTCWASQLLKPNLRGIDGGGVEQLGLHECVAQSFDFLGRQLHQRWSNNRASLPAE